MGRLTTVLGNLPQGLKKNTAVQVSLGRRFVFVPVFVIAPSR